MEEIILYSNGCPRCKIIEKRLEDKGIRDKKITDTEEMLRLGLTNVPWIKTKDTIMNFKDSIDYINNIQ